MGTEILTFGDTEILFFFKKDVNIDKALVSNKISTAERNYKRFNGYMFDDYKVKPLHIMLPKTSAFVTSK